MDRKGILIQCFPYPFIFILLTRMWQLDLAGSMINILAAGGLCLFLYKLSLRQTAYEKHMEDTGFYMEQMVRSFRRNHKIRMALSDVSRISEGTLLMKVTEALQSLEGTIEQEDIFKASLRFVEDMYGCRLMSMIHVFMIRVEEEGGECDLTMDALLAQVRSWKYEQRLWHNRRLSIRTKLCFSVLMACLVITACLKMVPGAASVQGALFSRILLAAGLLLFQIMTAGFYYMPFRQTGKKAKRKEDSEIDKLYEGLRSRYKGFKYRKTCRTLEKLIRIHFPEWLFDIALRLQTENVATAISNSLESSPKVLREPLCRLIHALEENPVSLQAYMSFTEELNLPEIRSAMLQLHAVNDMGKDEIQQQISLILQDNMKLEDDARNIQLEDAASLSGMMAAIPMFEAVVIMIVIMGSVMLTFLSQMNTL
ncbi:MAG: hypothetical protein ACSW8A_08805 [Lachnospiraceae bacterium]